MIGILISAALLSAIMFLVARHEADYSFPKVLLISIGIGICNLVLTIFTTQLIALAGVLGLTVWALHQFCYLRWRMAGIITGIYLVALIVLGLIFSGLTS